MPGRNNFLAFERPVCDKMLVPEHARTRIGYLFGRGSGKEILDDQETQIAGGPDLIL
jgi:hypothetical protein